MKMMTMTIKIMKLNYNYLCLNHLLIFIQIYYINLGQIKDKYY